MLRCLRDITKPSKLKLLYHMLAAHLLWCYQRKSSRRFYIIDVL